MAECLGNHSEIINRGPNELLGDVGKKIKNINKRPSVYYVPKSTHITKPSTVV